MYPKLVLCKICNCFHYILKKTLRLVFTYTVHKLQWQIQDFSKEGDFCKRGGGGGDYSLSDHQNMWAGACFLYFSYMLAQNGPFHPPWICPWTCQTTQLQPTFKSLWAMLSECRWAIASTICLTIAAASATKLKEKSHSAFHVLFSIHKFPTLRSSAILYHFACCARTELSSRVLAVTKPIKQTCFKPLSFTMDRKPCRHSTDAPLCIYLNCQSCFHNKEFTSPST